MPQRCVFVFVPQVNDLSQSLLKDAWEVISFDDLVVLALVDDEEEFESAILVHCKCNLVVAPLVVFVVEQSVVSLVDDVD